QHSPKRCRLVGFPQLNLGMVRLPVLTKAKPFSVARGWIQVIRPFAVLVLAFTHRFEEIGTGAIENEAEISPTLKRHAGKANDYPLGFKFRRPVDGSSFRRRVNGREVQSEVQSLFETAKAPRFHESG